MYKKRSNIAIFSTKCGRDKSITHGSPRKLPNQYDVQLFNVTSPPSHAISGPRAPCDWAWFGYWCGFVGNACRFYTPYAAYYMWPLQIHNTRSLSKLPNHFDVQLYNVTPRPSHAISCLFRAQCDSAGFWMLVWFVGNACHYTPYTAGYYMWPRQIRYTRRRIYIFTILYWARFIC